MPSRFRVKLYAPNTYYHVYNRGVAKRKIFRDTDDYSVFLNLFKRYLGGKVIKDLKGRPYDDLSKSINLLGYCLMPNHFHILVFQKDPHGITTLIRRVTGSYSGYFNKKYRRVGPLFQDRFKASIIDQEPYLWHISRYIHLNPAQTVDDAFNYKYSSLPYYLGKRKSSWIKPQRILAMHKQSKQPYKEFVVDGVDYKKTLDIVESQLAK